MTIDELIEQEVTDRLQSDTQELFGSVESAVSLYAPEESARKMLNDLDAMKKTLVAVRLQREIESAKKRVVKQAMSTRGFPS